MPPTRDNYVFFWKPDQPNGWASQWYESPFKARIDIGTSPMSTSHSETTDDNDKEDDGTKEYEFPTAEHWMMACKARLFNDMATLQRILNTPAYDMRAVKALGREVTPFNDATWNAHREHIVYVGNLHKFRQNPELWAHLDATGDKELAEASPRDRIWGVGFGEKNALAQRKRWGLILLGKALGRVRETLRRDMGGVRADR